MAILIIAGLGFLLWAIAHLVDVIQKARATRFGRFRDLQAELTRKEMELLERTQEAEKRLAQKELEQVEETQKAQENLSHAKNALEECHARDKEAILALAKEKAVGFPWLAKAYDEYFELSDIQSELNLITKKHPAIKEAERYKHAAAAKRKALAENRVRKYQIAYYEYLFPWLTDYRDAEIDDASIQVFSEEMERTQSDDGLERDPAEYWLTASEYENLSTSEKYQMALDRYWNNKKSPWEVGRLYERYVGYLFEQQGFSVTYHGILEGYEDLGRDLICQRRGLTLIVQCKCWKRVKIIHEKHINQLYGTTAKYLLELQEVGGTFDLFNDHKVVAHFVTSATLSEKAAKFAKALKIEVLAGLTLIPFPCIKCNIGQDGEKIFHLPFDQQYDRTIVSPERGEFYANTIAEAEGKGFRRAWRWRGTKHT